MYKKILISCLIIFGLILGINLVFAKNEKTPGDNIPEKNGVYDVPGHSSMKVKVFVYKEKPVKPDKPGKPGKPEPPAPELICYLDDPIFGPFVGPTGWMLPVTWEYNLNLSSVPSSVGNENLVAIAENAFNEWTDVLSGEVVLTRGEDTRTNRKALDGQNIIAWGRASAGTLAVAYIWYYPDTGEVVEIDTIMNRKYSWTWSDPLAWDHPTCAFEDSYDAQNILTHELGHWFGLNDHYTAEYENNTMFGYGSKTETKKNTLTSGDVAGIKALY